MLNHPNKLILKIQRIETKGPSMQQISISYKKLCKSKPPKKPNSHMQHQKDAICNIKKVRYGNVLINISISMLQAESASATSKKYLTNGQCNVSDSQTSPPQCNKGRIHLCNIKNTSATHEKNHGNNQIMKHPIKPP
jgi:hypothetical protein